jgi:hypothetical protein
MLDVRFVHQLNDVVAVNYYGEVLAVELISKLLTDKHFYRYREILSRQLVDETRHANITRKFLLARGRDPLRDDRPGDFTFSEIFRDFMARGGEGVLALLGENEKISSRNFTNLIQIGAAQHDEELVSLYSEILNDEVTHTTQIFKWLPQNDPAIDKARDEARKRMTETFNPRYLRLFARYRPQGKSR